MNIIYSFIVIVFIEVWDNNCWSDLMDIKSGRRSVKNLIKLDQMNHHDRTTSWHSISEPHTRKLHQKVEPICQLQNMHATSQCCTRCSLRVKKQLKVTENWHIQAHRVPLSSPAGVLKKATCTARALHLNREKGSERGREGRIEGKGIDSAKRLQEACYYAD